MLVDADDGLPETVLVHGDMPQVAVRHYVLDSTTKRYSVPDFICAKCPVISATVDLAIRHYITKHSLPVAGMADKFRCPYPKVDLAGTICGKVSPHALYSHSTCLQVLARSSLYDHWRKHSDEKPRCPTCGNRFFNERGLALHRRTQHQE